MSGLHGVLVVDDEMLIRQGIINYISWEKEGFQIVGEASNGSEALQLIEQLRPHIILTDVVMPGMDGIELVRIVKERYPEIEIIVLSSFENFDYVRSTFQFGVADYILKPKLNGEDLIKALRKIVPASADSETIRQNPATMEELLAKTVSGYSLTQGEHELTEAFPFAEFCLLSVCHSENAGDSLTWEQTLKQLKSEVCDVEGWLVPNNESDNMAILLNFDPNQLFALKQAVTNLPSQNQDKDSSVYWLMSKPFSSFYELRTVYEEDLLKMEDYLFYLTDEPVLIYDSLPEVVNTTGRDFDLSRFIDFFKQKRFEFAIQSLTKHIDLLSRDYTKDIFEFKSWLENIIFNTIVLLGNMKYDTEDLEAAKYEYFHDINEARHSQVAIARFHDFLEKVQELVMTDDNRSYPPNMQRLLRYIEENYARPLSLTTLAERFHFNPSYLSSYFSTHLHEGFSEYLNQVRIEKAKHMLKSSSASITVVSEMVGYSEPSYFCKVFKRIEGASPSRYRKESLSSEVRTTHEKVFANYSK